MLIVPEQELQRLREENQKLAQTIAELQTVLALVRDERNSAERRLCNAEWKLAEADESLRAIEETEEEMRRDGRLIDPLKPNWKQQVRLINERERRELEAN